MKQTRRVLDSAPLLKGLLDVMDDVLIRFGENMRARRLKLGMRIERLSVELNEKIASSTLYTYERGAGSVGLVEAVLIAKVLGFASVDEMLQEPPKTPSAEEKPTPKTTPAKKAPTRKAKK